MIGRRSIRKTAFLIWGPAPKPPEFTAFRPEWLFFGWTTIEALERRIGLSRNGTRAPTQAPEWQGRLRSPLKSDPPVHNLLQGENGLDNRDHFRLLPNFRSRREK